MNQAERVLAEFRIKHAKRFIWVTFQREGIHCYPAAAVEPTLEDVGFLCHPHRHIFHFRIGIEVFHNDRDIEFIQFKRFCERLYDSKTLELNSKSCEMIADDLFIQITNKYGGRKITIEVSEDAENGCSISY
jgi:hypothetical protein